MFEFESNKEEGRLPFPQPRVQTSNEDFSTRDKSHHSTGYADIAIESLNSQNTGSRPEICLNVLTSYTTKIISS